MEEMITSRIPEPANIDFSSPPLSSAKKSPWTAILVFLLVATLSAAGYLYWQNMKLQSQLATSPSPSTSSTPLSSVSPSDQPDPKPPQNLIPDKSTWRKYTSSDFVYQNKVYKSYSLSFPSSCEQVVSTIDCKLSNGTATIVINAGGHGGVVGNFKPIKTNEPKAIIAGSGLISQTLNLDTNSVSGTYWINKTDDFAQEPIIGFEFMEVPYADFAEFEKLFDDILSTLTFVK